MGGGLIAALAGPFIIEVLFGRAYGEATAPLRILCLGTAIYAPLGLLNLYFVNQLGRPQIAVGIGLAGLSASMVSGLLLIPPFGTAGAAWATTLSYALATTTALVIFLRRTHLPPSQLWRVRSSDVAAYFELAGTLLVDTQKVGRRALAAVRRAPAQP